MSVYVDRFVGFISDISDEYFNSNLENLSKDEEDMLRESLSEYRYNHYYSGRELSVDEIVLVVDGMCGEYAKLVYVKLFDRESSNESEANPVINEALLQCEVPLEVREKMQKVFSKLFDSERVLDIHFQEFVHWR